MNLTREKNLTRQLRRICGAWAVSWLLLCNWPITAQRKPAAPPPAPTPANVLENVPDGGFLQSWLISNAFPTEIDAGSYENFQRFNIEFLPENDWLQAFGGAAQLHPQAGTLNATTGAVATPTPTPRPGAPVLRPRADVPEVGATESPNATNAPLSPATVTTVTWQPYQATGAQLAFAALTGAAKPGTAYAAAYFTASETQSFFLETDGFLGTIWLNGVKVYDGFTLSVQRVVFVQVQAGQNLLMLRASGIKNDGWRKDGGWTANLRWWRARSVGPMVWVGALRPAQSWQNTADGVGETVKIALANKSEMPVPFAVNIGAESGASRILSDELRPDELRDAELVLPLKESAKIPNGRRRVQAQVGVGPHRAMWETFWDATPPPADGTIFYLEGFHVDPVYLHDQRGYARITLSNTSQYISSLRADAAYGVYLSEIDYLKPYYDTHPADRALLRDAIKQGRVGTGGTYNQFNELNIGGEAIIRNILYGRGFHENVLGDKPRALPLWDVFGHAPQITQIARKSGFDGIVWSKKITGFPSFFYDYALDGSRLLHRRLDYAYSFSGFGSGKNYGFEAFRQMTERKFAETVSLKSANDLRINAADFTPPWTNLAGRVARLDANRPRIRVTGQAQTLYFDELNKEIAAGKLSPPVSSRDKLFFHVGVALARSDLKIGQRLTENMTLNAERFGALAYLRGAAYPDLALDKAWRQILFNSHHDAITGTPSDNALLDLVHGYREAYELSRDALNDALDFLNTQINTRPPPALISGLAGVNALPVVVYNPMSWPRNDLARAQVAFPTPMTGYEVRDDKGQSVPRQAVRETRDAQGRVTAAEISFVAREVPSLGYRTYYVVPVQQLQLPKLSLATTIENEFFRITVSPQRGGAISSLYDKTAQRELAAPDGSHLLNEIGALSEELTKKNVIYPAWELWTTGERRFSSATEAQVSAEIGGSTQRLIVTGQLPAGPKYRQVIELHEGVRRVDCRTELLNYQGRDELFTVNFPLNLKNGALVTEDRFGTVTRNRSLGQLDYRTNTDKLVSGAPVYAAYNWAEYGATATLKFTQPDGQMLAQVALRPTALIRPHTSAAEQATEKIVAALAPQGISVTPLYDDADAPRRAQLAIEDTTLPRKLNDDIAYHSFRIVLGGPQENAYSQKICQANFAACHGWSERLGRDGFGYLFAYDKDTPEGWPPLPVLLIAGRDENHLLRAVSELLAPLTQRGTHVLSLPAEIVADPAATQAASFANDYGFTLINGGAPATSLERPEMLSLLLTHTALWPGINLDFSFTPEHKTHVFTYSLVPHAGDWRTSNAVRAGYEFNNPLIARQTPAHEGTLPASQSFLRVGADNVILSALKLGGNPYADFRATDGPRPLIARFYEATGAPTETALEFSGPVTNAAETDLLERGDKPLTVAGNRVSLAFTSFGINTYRLATPPAKPTGAVLGATAEPVQPVVARYWQHNQGAAPLGNDMVKVTLQPVEQMGALSNFAYQDAYNQGGTTTTAVRVVVVNNYLDKRIAGTVKLEVAPDWRVVPETLDYAIEPGGSWTQDVVVVTFPVKQSDAWARASGLVKARLEHGGQTYQDVLAIGQPLKLQWFIERNANGATFVRVRNPTRQRIEGAIAFIMPPEVWANALIDNDLPPRERGFALAAKEDLVWPLPSTAQLNGAWAVVRLSYNGSVEYLRADGRTVEPAK